MSNSIPNSNALPVGTILHGPQFNYRITATLGHGTFGITYLAELIDGTKPSAMLVCVKEFFMSDINGREGSSVSSGSDSSLFANYAKKFVREARNLARIRHENVVKVIENFEENNTFYYSMSYIDGGSLDKLLEESGPISEERTIKIAIKLTEALESLHKDGMVHLDIKPGNIMMLPNDAPVLIDFGLAKNFDNNGIPESSTSLGGGTPGYAPIEQSNQTTGDGVPVTMDIYALGGTLFKMLTGMRPPIAASILQDGFPVDTLIGCGVSDSMITVIQTAMQPKKSERFQSMAAFRNALNFILNVPTESTVVSVAQVADRTEYVNNNGNNGDWNNYSKRTPPAAVNIDNSTKDKKREKGSGIWKTVVITAICTAAIFVSVIFLTGKTDNNNADVTSDTTAVTEQSHAAAEVEKPKESSDNSTTEASGEKKNTDEGSVSYMANTTVNFSGDASGFPFTLKIDWGSERNGTITGTGTYHNVRYNVTLPITHASYDGYDLVAKFGSAGDTFTINASAVKDSRPRFWGTFVSVKTGKKLDVELSID